MKVGDLVRHRDSKDRPNNFGWNEKDWFVKRVQKITYIRSSYW